MRCRIFLQEMSKQLLQPQFQRRSTVARLSSAIKKSIASVVPNNEDTGETAGTARATVSSKNQYRKPHPPAIPTLDGFRGAVLHSGEYRNGEKY
ncbi:hypothetical protein RvY_12227 [Ramazzottius varieornatus]|uniref:Uncharacterized protein n=1 Tax=Ramazzottius varieornatus TaxID=947166 RepID=A0A1D1VKS8_RAMVA|nr:hypothetical protein RvY_12227 [Ramazzottius varieornatus]